MGLNLRGDREIYILHGLIMTNLNLARFLSKDGLIMIEGNIDENISLIGWMMDYTIHKAKERQPIKVLWESLDE